MKCFATLYFRPFCLKRLGRNVLANEELEKAFALKPELKNSLIKATGEYDDLMVDYVRNTKVIL